MCVCIYISIYDGPSLSNLVLMLSQVNFSPLVTLLLWTKSVEK